MRASNMQQISQFQASLNQNMQAIQSYMKLPKQIADLA
jgi:hypothetical protein